MIQNKKPQGELTIQTFAMPGDTNANGDIFGGWLLSQMDLSASVIAKQRSKSRVTTVAIDSMVFHHPVHVGDLVSCYAYLQKVGKTSMTIKVEAWTMDRIDFKQRQVTEGVFTYVAINKDGKPHPVDQK